jgi:cytochrome P450
MQRAGSSEAPATIAARCPFDPFSPSELVDPYPTLERMRAEAPVFHASALDRWIVTRQEDVLDVIRDAECFSNRVAMPFPEPPEAIRHRLPIKNGRAVYPSALTPLVMDGDDHRRARKVIQAPFTPRALRTREPMIRGIAERLLDEASGPQIDLVNEYALPYALEVVSRIVGVPGGALATIRRGIDSMFKLNGLALADSGEVLAAAEELAEYWECLTSVAADRMANPVDDFASVIAHAEVDGVKPTKQEVTAHLHSLIGPGFETTAQAITHGLAQLLSLPDQWELLKSRPELLESAVMEMLRYRTVAKLIFRQATRDVTVGGVAVPEGAILALSLASANRDERCYDDANAFDIKRNADNLALGRWKHYCVGAPLAKIELRVTLETLINRFPDASVVPNQTLSWRRDIRIDALDSLLVDLGPPAPCRSPDALFVE